MVSLPRRDLISPDGRQPLHLPSADLQIQPVKVIVPEVLHCTGSLVKLNAKRETSPCVIQPDAVA
jgi:hypothetical protein